MSRAYDAAFKRSLKDPEGFWAEAAADIHWYKPWDRVLDASNPPFYRWFRRRRDSTPATTRSTAMSKPAAATRPR